MISIKLGAILEAFFFVSMAAKERARMQSHANRSIPFPLRTPPSRFNDDHDDEVRAKIRAKLVVFCSPPIS